MEPELSAPISVMYEPYTKRFLERIIKRPDYGTINVTISDYTCYITAMGGYPSAYLDKDCIDEFLSLKCDMLVFSHFDKVYIRPADWEDIKIECNEAVLEEPVSGDNVFKNLLLWCAALIPKAKTTIFLTDSTIFTHSFPSTPARPNYGYYDGNYFKIGMDMTLENSYLRLI